MPKLSTHAPLSDVDYYRVLRHFAVEKWKEKSVVGDPSGSRTPCIHLEKNQNYRFKNLFAHQAAYIVQNGPVKKGYTISHLCTSLRQSSRRISSCINYLHMIEQKAKDNSGRNGEQKDLRDYVKTWQHSRKEFSGPVFYNRDEHMIEETVFTGLDSAYPSFINCGHIGKVNGLYFYEPSLKLRSRLRTSGFDLSKFPF